jgi:small subunit ribosomal protein S16
MAAVSGEVCGEAGRAKRTKDAKMAARGKTLLGEAVPARLRGCAGKLGHYPPECLLDTAGRGPCFPTFSKSTALVPRPYMALKIRLSRIGSTHNPVYHVVVAEARSRRDGAATEILGTYNPRAKKDGLLLKVDRVDHWISKGALPTDTAKSLIKIARKAAAPAA